MTAGEALDALGVECLSEDGAVRDYRAVFGDAGAALVDIADADHAWALLGALIGRDVSPLRNAGYTVSGVVCRLGWA